MRYNGIIILRIVDFRDFFTFEEFWKNRKLFPLASQDPRFKLGSDDKAIENICITIVNEWLEDEIVPSYRMSGNMVYMGTKWIGNLDKDVYQWLSSQPDAVIQKNIMGLCALYQLLRKGERLYRLKNDLDVIKSILSLASIDFSKPLIEFEEAGKTVEATFTVCEEGYVYPVHLVWIKNKSNHHKVVLLDKEKRGVVLRTLKPNECTLAVFSSNNQWIAELPVSCSFRDYSTSLIQDEDGSSRRFLQVTHRPPETKRSRTTRLSKPVLSFSADADGYIYVVEDSHHPVRCSHPRFDSERIAGILSHQLEKDEVVLYASINGPSLTVLTNERTFTIAGTE